VLRIFDAILHPVTGSVDEDGLHVVDDAVEHGGGEGGVVVQDSDPMLVGFVGGDDGGSAFIAAGDDLEEEIGAVFVDRQIPEFIQKEDAWSEVFFEFRLEAVSGLGGGEVVDDVHGRGVEDGMAGHTGGMSQRDGEMGLAQADAPTEDDVGVLFEKAEFEKVLNLEAVDLPGPGPLELLKGFDPGKAREPKPAAQALLLALLDLAVGEPGEIIAVGPMVARSLIGEARCWSTK